MSGNLAELVYDIHTLSGLFVARRFYLNPPLILPTHEKLSKRDAGAINKLGEIVKTKKKLYLSPSHEIRDKTA